MKWKIYQKLIQFQIILVLYVKVKKNFLKFIIIAKIVINTRYYLQQKQIADPYESEVSA